MPLGRMAFIVSVFLAACIIFVGRLVNLQFASGNIYDTGFSSVNTTVTEIPTVRGQITDINGVVLASNITYNNITLDKKQIPYGSEYDTALALCRFFRDNRIEYRDVLPVSVSPPFLLDTDFEESPDKQKAVRSYAKYMGLNEEKLTENSTVLYDTLISRYKLKNTDCTEEERRLVCGLLFTLDVNTYATNLPCILVERADPSIVGIISDSFHKFPGIAISHGTQRYYNIDGLASHTLGRTGPIFAENAAYYSERGYSLNETVGKEGAEYAFEEYLRGINGKLETVTSIDGENIISEKVLKPAKPGYTVTLTIDAEMQAVAENALENTIKAQARKGAGTIKRFDGEDANAGAVVVMDPRDGAVKVSASYPSYNLNTYGEDISVLSKDTKNTPLVNRVTGGIYEPGSTFKIATAAAALYHGVTTFDELIYDKGEYFFHETYKPHCWIYDSKGQTHGFQNVVQAIQNSCNYYFFEMGKRLGIEKINEYAKSLGLGVKTGIETGESTGLLVSPRLMDANGLAWNPGYVLQAAIGQQHLFTPIQITSYICAFLNGGKRYEAHLFSKASDYSTGEVVAQYQPRILSDAQIPQEHVSKLKEAMRRVVDDGTASSTFIGYKYPVGGKTGTAQVANGSDNVIFVGFAPYDNPEIVVTVILEHGDQSRNAAQVAKEIFDCYFSKKYPEDFGIAEITPEETNSTEETEPTQEPETPDITILGDAGTISEPAE